MVTWLHENSFPNTVKRRKAYIYKYIYVYYFTYIYFLFFLYIYIITTNIFHFHLSIGKVDAFSARFCILLLYNVLQEDCSCI